MAAVITDPGSSTRNVIQPTGDFTALTLRANAAQTVPIFKVEDSASNPYITLFADGRIDLNSAIVNGAQLDITTTDASRRVLTLRAPAAPTTDIMRWAIGGTTQGTINSQGCLTVTPAALTNSGTMVGTNVQLTHTVPAAGTGTTIGQQNVVFLTATGASGGSPTALGFFGDVQIQNVSAGNSLTNALTLAGIRVRARAVGSVMAGTVAGLTGILIDQWGFTNNPAGVITNANGLYITGFNAASTNGGTITTATGLRIDNITGAGTNIAMQIGTGNLGFNGATPVVKQTGASAAGIAAIVDANAKAAIGALQTALANYGFVTSPA